MLSVLLLGWILLTSRRRAVAFEELRATATVAVVVALVTALWPRLTWTQRVVGVVVAVLVTLNRLHILGGTDRRRLRLADRPAVADPIGSGISDLGSLALP